MKTISRIQTLCVLLLACFASSAQQPRTVSQEEADAFEKASAVHSGNSSQQQNLLVYVQPLNKTEPCQIPSSKSQVARGNFKVYWDGECKDGFAFGFGRDIALSDTHHYEEITHLSERGQARVGGISIFFDFPGRTAIYSHVRSVDDEGKPSASDRVAEEFRSIAPSAPYTMTKRREGGDAVLQVQRLPLRAQPVLVGYFGEGIFYRHTDWTDLPYAAQAGVFEVFDISTRRQSPWVLVADKLGQLHGLERVDGSSRQVELPVEYAKRVLDKSRQALAIEAEVDQVYFVAKRVEREYLYGVCENNRQGQGIPQETYTKVCSWMKENEEGKRSALTAYAAEAERRTGQAAQMRVQQAPQAREIAPRQVPSDLNSALADFVRSTAKMREDAERFTRSGSPIQPSAPSFGPPSTRVQNCMAISGILTCR